MHCPNCQTQNPDTAKFCMNCGTALALACPNCATELPAGAKFCFNCGHQMNSTVAAPTALAPVQGPATEAPQESFPLAAQTVADVSMVSGAGLERFIPQGLLSKLQHARSSGAMVGERRIVTMLFCDVKGSTAAAGQLDPEEWAEIINGAFACMIEPVYKYEGTLARLMGDAILAFFGAPIAHEDDPQRAVLAALEIADGIQHYRRQVSQTWGLDLNVRVGINTGLVVVGAVGSDLRMEYSALGDAINLAARMEQTAQPGTIQIAEPTYKLVAPLFEFEELGAIEVKGKDEPVPVYRALRAKTQPGRTRGIQGLESPLVGREAELGELRAALSALQQGSGAILSLIAEAGLGKSRLVAELRQLAPAAHKAPSWLEGRSLSYETNTPYAPFIDIFSAHFDLPAEQAADEKYASIKNQVDALAPGQALAPFLAALLGIAPTGPDAERVRFLEPPSLRQAIFQAVCSYLESLALQQPLVLVLDDIHWIDPSSLELLQTLLPLSDRVPLLLLALFRPHRQEPSWQFHEIAQRSYAHRYRALFLQPLQTEDARQLVANLLHIEDLPDSVCALILEKAEGNPFFVEEVTRSLLDAGLVVQRDGQWHATREIEQISVPDTLVAVITSRLDRLDENLRSLLQSAAVIGRQFRYDTLKAIHPTANGIEPLLVELQRRELIRETARIPERIYMFKHAMTQEATYESLLLRARRELHLRVAEELEQTTPDAVTDLALHFLAARQPARALPYLVTAGERATRLSAHREAIVHLSKGLTLVENAPDMLKNLRYELRLQIALGVSLAATKGWSAPEVGQRYERARMLSQQLNDESRLGSILWGLLSFYSVRGNLRTAHALGEQYLRLAQSQGDASLLVVGHFAMGIPKFHLGNLDDVRVHLEQIEAAYQPEAQRAYIALFGLDFGAFSSAYKAHTLWFLGYPEQALQQGMAAVALAQQTDHSFTLTVTQCYAAMLYQFRREWQPAQALVDTVLAQRTEHELPYYVAWATIIRGWALSEQGNHGDGIWQMQQGLATLRAMGTRLRETYYLGLLAEALGKAGRIDEGLRLVDEALVLSYGQEERIGQAELYRLSGELLDRRGEDEARVEECFLQAINIAQIQGTMLLELRAVMSLCRLWQRQGKAKAARQLLTPIAQWFTEGFEIPDLQEAQDLLNRLSG